MKMNKVPQENNFDENKLLFLEIATVSHEKSYSDLEKNNPTIAKIFADSRFSLAERFPDFKSGIEENRIDSKFLYEKCAGIYPEFGRIVCVSLGALDSKGEIKITTFTGSEREILLKTRTVLNTAASKYTLCGHNIKSFDLPYLGKRYLINGLRPPSLLPTHETKPWEVKAIDTRDIWTFSGFKSFSSLHLIANLMGIEVTSYIKGEDVSKLFWGGELDKVMEFCESEIKITIEIIKKYNSYE